MCPLDGEATTDGKTERAEEYRVLSCAVAKSEYPSSYGIYINEPAASARKVPNGWVLKRMGEVTAVAQDGWANMAFYVGSKLIGYGYALEHRQVTRIAGGGKVIQAEPWSSSKTGDCTLSNPEVYIPQSLN